MKKYGVLFDYNGVIVDDEHIHEKTYRETLAQYGIRLTHEMHARYMKGRKGLENMQTMKDIFPEKLDKLTPEELLSQKIESYRRIVQNQSIVYPQASIILAQLVTIYKIAIVSNAPKKLVLPYLEKEDLSRFFEVIVTADEIVNGKPDPEPYRKAMNMLEIIPEEGVAIEDTPLGVQSAKSAGLACIAVLHTYPKEELHQADLIISGIGELSPEVIERAFNL